jgi:hypothetical protein
MVRSRATISLTLWKSTSKSEPTVMNDEPTRLCGRSRSIDLMSKRPRNRSSSSHPLKRASRAHPSLTCSDETRSEICFRSGVRGLPNKALIRSQSIMQSSLNPFKTRKAAQARCARCFIRDKMVACSRNRR